MKTCNMCCISKPYHLFTKHKMARDGHINQCKACRAKIQKDKRSKNLETYRETERKSKRKNYNSAKESKKKKEEYKRNRKKILLRNKKYFLSTYDKRKHLYTKQSAKRRANKLKSTPSWLTQDQLEAIKDMYTLSSKISALTGQPMEVDHMVPLQGENVCGLHVPWNLQLLHRSKNRSKGNKYNEW